MALNDYVSITITSTTVGAQRAGFGTGLLLSATAAWAERTRLYSSLSEVAVDFPVTTSAEYRYAQAYFAQSPAPSKLMIGRSANKPTQAYQLSALNPTSNVSYTYQVKVKGKGFSDTTVSFTSDATPTDAEYAAGMVSALNAVASKNFTASGASSPITITANSAGDWFSIEVVDVNYQKVTQTHADPGVAADLTAITAENPNWYTLITAYNSKLYAVAAAGWVETASRIYVADTNDTTTITTATGNADLMDTFKTNAYTRSSAHYHPSPADAMGAALAGKCLPYDPGSETWKYKTLSGVATVALTSTHRSNITSRNGNSYESVAGIGVTFDGKNGDGSFIDARRGLDWLTDDLQKGLLTALTSASKIPYTDDGISAIEAQVRGSLDRAVQRGVLTRGTITVTVPAASAVSAADKTSRTLNNVRFSATGAGAIHGVNVTGTVGA